MWGSGDYAAATMWPMIRLATVEDAPEVARVFRAARAGMTYLPVLHTAEEDGEFIRRLIGECEVHVACHRGTGAIMGFLALSDTDIEDLYLAPAHQGEGVGGILLALAKKRRPRGLSLWVFQANQGAVRFYQRHGFVIAESSDGHYNEEGLPDHRMTWRPAVVEDALL
jgi:ribosomal protein S18 acetylase RimI-like enzyme